jgi:hypothetical protein
MEPSPLVGNDGVAAAASEVVAAPAQNSLANAAGQPTSDSWRSHTDPLAPWIIQGLWLTALAAAAVYIRLRSWGMFEAIAYMVAAVFAMSAWLTWSIAWSLFAQQSLLHRLVQLAAAVAAMLIVADWIFEWWQQGEWQILFALTRVSVGIALPLALMRWRGWRIRWQAWDACGTTLTAVGRMQFSIGELLLLTAGAAAFLGLTVTRENFGLHSHWGEIVTECVVVVCGTLFVIVGLRARRFAVAALVCPLVALAIIAAAMATVDPAPLARPSEWLLIVLICCPAMAAMLVAIGLARWWGYRLAPT